jgi:hypothetical protein
LRAAVDPETENNDYYAPSFLQMWIGASKASVVPCPEPPSRCIVHEKK